MKFWQRAQNAGFKIPELPTESRERTFPDTNCVILDGKLVASLIADQCKELGKGRKQPKLAAILAGEDPASQVYVGSKGKSFANVGFASETILIPSSEASSDKLIETIEKLNADVSVSGILLQLPLPNKMDEAAITARIKREKDVDGFLAANMGLLAIGNFKDTFLACTPFGVMVLLAAYGINPAGKNMVVVGRSNIVGKPMALLGISADSTVTVAHSRTKNLPEICRNADILIAAVGKRALITKEFVKPGSVVIDVGIHRDENGKISGDVAADVRYIASALTPVPGGVGPLTIAMLTMNTALAAWN
ncbi:MAG: bifunctional 5,10-methylenetetrahydrofolate dehydrogenase/5,10-methenyltetrahydrofolate cyclohydrolase [Burkholderiales bacterium]|nr:MAG: bifunctional 5,10-methylenetetrahydrofolate dehydrogenase/5,10-methenyltetrahydrofolate cyclohydrolase [Burkholderiales bacterium]